MHTAEKNIAAGCVGGILLGEDHGVLVDGDLTTLAAAKAAVVADMAKKHSSEKTIGPRVTAALDQADNYVASYTGGGDVSDISTVFGSNVRGRMLRF